MTSASDYVANYPASGAEKVAFAWNGKHAAEFVDSNYDFRKSVVDYCLANESAPDPALLADLFRADAEWSRQAWCAPNHFPDLATLLLIRGEESVLGAFAEGFGACFDTFGACHQMGLPAETLSRLTAGLQERICSEPESERRKPLEAALELFEKFSSGTASQGWVQVAPGTPVTNIRVVYPRWYHRLWNQFKSLFATKNS